MLRLKRDILLIGLALATAAGCATAASEGASSSSADTTGVSDAGDAGVGDAAPGVVRGPSATTMAHDIAAAGLDINNLPELHDLDMTKKMKVMRTFNKSMGVQCNACHDLSDYSIMTPQKEAADLAWNTIVRGMSMPDGGSLYCDSCHYGKLHFLDRADRPTLMQWMNDNFVNGLVHKDSSPMACTSCHKTDPTTEDAGGGY
jgi:hypothetical protein